MSRPIPLTRSDIRSSIDRASATLTLRYVGRRLRPVARLFGFPELVFFAVALNEIPLPTDLETLASVVKVDLNTFPLTAELRRAIAEVLAAEAMLQAPELLSEVAAPHAEWVTYDIRALEHNVLAAERKLKETSNLVEAHLRRRIVASQRTVAPTFIVVPPADVLRPRDEPQEPEPKPFFEPPALPPEPVTEPEQSAEAEVSEATGARVLAAVKTAREQELQQRLPGGARRALAKLPSGLYVAQGTKLTWKPNICSALVAGAENGRRSGESAVIDWDGEWPVVARRYGENGRIVYRVEQALRRNGYVEDES